MTTLFPTAIDSFTNPLATNPTTSPSHSAQHSNENDSILALETKVGANGSAVTTSIDYKLSGVPATDKVVSKTGTETLTNKTITSPVITTPTGIVKGDVGLGNIDNTSDATKNSATATLANKRVARRVGTEASSATSAINADLYDQWTITALAVGDAIAAPSGTPVQGDTLLIRIKDNGTARALTWNAIFRFSLELIVPSTTIISKTLYVGFVYNSADSKWDCLLVLNNV